MPLLVAVGRVVFAAAGLEKALQLELSRLLFARLRATDNAGSTLAKALSRLDGLTAGQLLKELRDLKLSTELHDRIEHAIKRRNDLVHRTFEDSELAKALAGTGDLEGVIRRINELAIDCGTLAVELQAFAIPKLGELLGRSPLELVDLVESIDPGSIADSRTQRQLEAVQAFADQDSLTSMLRELGIRA